MEHETYSESVTKGGKRALLSKSEVVLAVFKHAYEREPTATELDRASIDVDEPTEGYGRWELTLSVDDSPSRRIPGGQ